MKTNIPRAPLWLGLAGLIPPLMLTAIGLFELGIFAPNAPGFVRSYAAIILSFLGGTWWAFACREERPRAFLLVLAVLPSLAAWATMIWFVPAQALFALAGLLLASLVIDALLVGWRLAPRWWMRLRVPLSGGLAFCCVVSGWVLGR